VTDHGGADLPVPGRAHGPGAGHAHGGAGVEVPRRTRRVLVLVAVVLAVGTAAGMAALWPREEPRAAEAGFLADDQFRASVVAVERVACSGTTEADGIDCDAVTFELEQGPHDGDERVIEFPVGESSPGLSRGDSVVLNHLAGGEEGQDYQYADRERRPILWALAALFAIAVVGLGRLRGFAALAGLVASIVVILEFVLPAILDGRSPVLVAVVGAAAIAYLALYLAHGFTTMTTVALIGTLASLGLTILLSWLFTEIAEFTGRGSEDAIVLNLLSGSVDLTGLVLAGIVIGALGALDDMTVTQASAVAELRAADPLMSRPALFAAGLRIGRDHVASTVNTLALAYVGAALPTMLLFVLSDLSLGAVANGEVVAVEIVRTLVGSIGLVAAVPITTWLAAAAVPGPVARVESTVLRRPQGPATAREDDSPSPELERLAAALTPPPRPAPAEDAPGAPQASVPEPTGAPGDSETAPPPAVPPPASRRTGRRRTRRRPGDDPDASFWSR
jgi:uncharacterized membrane protein